MGESMKKMETLEVASELMHAIQRVLDDSERGGQSVAHRAILILVKYPPECDGSKRLVETAIASSLPQEDYVLVESALAANLETLQRLRLSRETN